MAVETKKSTAIANRDSTPTVPVAASIAGGNLRSAEGFVTTSAAASTGSKYPLASVPSNSRVASVILQSAAQGAGCTANCGVYWPTNPPPASGATSGAAINATLFGSAIDVSAALAPTEITNQSGNNGIAVQEQELWQAAGLATDPGCNLDIGLALAAPTVAGGLIGLKVNYVQ